MEQVDRPGLPPEPPDVAAVHQRAPGGRVPQGELLQAGDLRDDGGGVQELDPPRDPVPVRVVGVLEREEGRVVHGLQVAEPGHRGRHELGDPGGPGREALGGEAGGGPVLELGAAHLPHGVEARRRGPAEAGEVEDQVALPLPGVALVARGRVEDGTHPLLHGEASAELLVALQVDGHLGRGQPVQRRVQHGVVLRQVREEEVAGGEGGAQQEEGEEPSHGGTGRGQGRFRQD